MHRRLAAIIAFLAVLAPSFARDTTTWVTVAPKGGGFSVKMPGLPIPESKTITESGFSYQAFRYQVVKGSLTYTVVRADLGAMVPAGEEDHILRNAIEGLKKSVRGELLTNELIDYQGHPARMAVLQDQNHGKITAFACWDGKHGHLVTLRGPASLMTQDHVKEFFDTFKLVSS